jgi:zinc protease
MQLKGLAEVLQIKITQHLREDESEVYSPSVQASYDKLPHGHYTITVVFGCAPKNVDHLVGLVQKEIAAVQKNGAVPEDVEKFRAEYKRGFEVLLQDNKFWLGYLSSQYQMNEDPLQVLDYETNLDKVTPATLKKAAKEYMSGNNRIEFVLLPETH